MATAMRISLSDSSWGTWYDTTNLIQSQRGTVTISKSTRQEPDARCCFFASEGCLDQLLAHRWISQCVLVSLCVCGFCPSLITSSYCLPVHASRSSHSLPQPLHKPLDRIVYVPTLLSRRSLRNKLQLLLIHLVAVQVAIKP